MQPDIHRWAVVLTLNPGRAGVSFLHISRGTGTQILDEALWPMSPDIRTERAYLSELWAATLHFQELRA